MDAFTPQQTIEIITRIGCKKAHMRLDKLFFNAFMTGPLLGFGCAWLLSVNASPWYQENAPGLIRAIGGMFFPIGLVLIVLTGSELLTSNFMFMTAAFLSRRITLKDVGISWGVSFVGNLAGTLFFVAIITGYGGVFEETEGYRQAAVDFAMKKAVQPQWHQIFLRGIGANWLVCLAVFLSISARDIASKIIAIWFPTACFVSLALDHVIANMFFIPTGIWVGAPAPLTVPYYIWKSLIPTLLGNMIGGGFFVGFMYWYLYLTGEQNVVIDFDLGSLESAYEAGGPMRKGDGTNGGKKVKAKDAKAGVIEGQAPPSTQQLDDEEKAIESSASSTRKMSPNGVMAGHLVSAFGREIGDSSPYAKTHAERAAEARGRSP